MIIVSETRKYFYELFRSLSLFSYARGRVTDVLDGTNDFHTIPTIHAGKYLTEFSVMAPAMSQGLDTASTSSDVTTGQ